MKWGPKKKHKKGKKQDDFEAMEDVLDDNCSYASMVSDTTDFSYATGCNPALKAAKRTCYGDEGATLRNNDNRISTTYEKVLGS